MLTDEQQSQIIERLDALMKQDGCPFCGGNRIQLSPHVIVAETMDPGAERANPGVGVTFVQVCCETCHHVQLFEAKPLFE